jgi:hypothetical protein
MEKTRQALVLALKKLLKPLVRLLLRNGIAYGEFADLAKQAYIEVANQDFRVPGRKQSLSRVAVITGIHRHEVGKHLKRETQAPSYTARHNRAARVISGWQSDPDFSDAGKARVLSIEDEFAVMVARHGADVTMRAVLDELERVGAVRRPEEGKVELLVEAFAPQDSIEDLIYIFGDCSADLLETLDHNLSCDTQDRRLQMSVVYNNLPDDVLANLELVSRERAMAFLTEIDKFFATQDRDSNPAVQGDGRNRAGIGLYYFQTPGDSEQRA